MCIRDRGLGCLQAGFTGGCAQRAVGQGAPPAVHQLAGLGVCAEQLAVDREVPRDAGFVGFGDPALCSDLSCLLYTSRCV